MIKLFLFLFLSGFINCENKDVLKTFATFIRCTNDIQATKCFKIEALKFANRALKMKNIQIWNGLNVVRDDRKLKNVYLGLNLNDTKLQKLENEELNDLLRETSLKFLETHQLQVKMPTLQGEEAEGRKSKNKGGGGGAALYWALAIKGTFLTMAYNGIAVMSGMALIMGKMALLLTAILGLKKLVSSGEKTTIEIVKKPKYVESHVSSTSYEDDSHHKSYDRADNISRIIRTYL